MKKRIIKKLRSRSNFRTDGAARRRAGFTLMELLIVLALFSFVLLGSTGVYISALKFFDALGIQESQVAPLYAVEHITRNLAYANLIVCDDALGGEDIPGWRTLKLRLDSKGTAFNYADDEWTVYTLFGSHTGPYTLRYQERIPQVPFEDDPDNPPAGYYDIPPITAAANESSPEVQEGLVFKTYSRFLFVPGDKTVRIEFIVPVG